ncbi:MAG: uroporphyrinogen-III synthase [Pseudomonadota bacterium]
MAQALCARGHASLVAPLSEITLHPDAVPDLAGFAGLVFTSRRGVDAVFASAQADHARQMVCFAVGPATAQALRDAQVARVIEGAGRARDLPAAIQAYARAEHTGPLRLFYAAARVISTDLAPTLAQHGHELLRGTLYETVGVRRLPDGVARALHGGELCGVILMAPSAAQTYATLIDDARLRREAHQLTHYCLSAQVAEALQALSPPKLEVAAAPNAQEMLALIGQGAKTDGRC